MGTWGVGTFDNDTAADWAFEMETAEDLTPVLLAITGLLQAGDETVDADDACCALAACEVVARLKGNWGVRDAYSEPVDRYVEGHPEEPRQVLVEGALAVIDRILKPPSELLELWQEEDAGAWIASVDDLRRRVAE